MDILSKLENGLERYLDPPLPLQSVPPTDIFCGLGRGEQDFFQSSGLSNSPLFVEFRLDDLLYLKSKNIHFTGLESIR